MIDFGKDWCNIRTDLQNPDYKYFYILVFQLLIIIYKENDTDEYYLPFSEYLEPDVYDFMRDEFANKTLPSIFTHYTEITRYTAFLKIINFIKHRVNKYYKKMEGYQLGNIFGKISKRRSRRSRR